jgi:hypothetical protein
VIGNGCPIDEPCVRTIYRCLATAQDVVPADIDATELAAAKNSHVVEMVSEIRTAS